MRQRKLDEFLGYRCPICGRKFQTDRGLKVHYARMHQGDSMIEPGEWVMVEKEGGYVKITIRMKKSLWNDISKMLNRQGIRFEDLLFDVLANMGAFGADVSLWRVKFKPEEVLLSI